MIFKLLVDSPSGEQRVELVTESGGYFDESRVLWDERTQGPLDEQAEGFVLGGMVRQGDSLVYSEARIQQHLAAIAPPIPDVVDALQGLLAIQAAGYSEAYTAWASSPDRTFTERAFLDKAIRWKRNDPTLQAGATALGLTSAQLDALFIAASQIIL